MFSFRDERGPVGVAFTDRTGGFPPGSRSLPEITASAFGAAGHLVSMEQVHGHGVALAESAGEVPDVDGVVTTVQGLVLAVRAADCVPVLLADPDIGIVGAAHAGRRGTAEGVVPATCRLMRSAGAGSLVAWLGPHICGRCYEVPAAMREDVAGVVPESWAETSWGTPALDLAAGVLAQLAAEQVEVLHVGGCTREDESLWSHRRDGDAAGRLAGLIGSWA